MRESAQWSVVWLAVALGFGAVLWSWQGGEAGSEYLAGYLLERSLSLDNLFVFAVLFSYFAVPAAVQPRVLSWGIALALVLRLIFILLGAALLGSFHVTFYAFGILLLYTAYKLARHDDPGIEPERQPGLPPDPQARADERGLRRHEAVHARERQARRRRRSSPSSWSSPPPT